MREKVTAGKHTGFLVENPSNDMGVLCSHEQGTSKKGKPYNSAQLTQVNKSQKGEWFVYGKNLSQRELANKRTGMWFPFPIELLPDIIRALNDLYLDITGKTVESADKTVKEEFDTVGEMLKETGFKDRGR